MDSTTRSAGSCAARAGSCTATRAVTAAASSGENTPSARASASTCSTVARARAGSRVENATAWPARAYSQPICEPIRPAPTTRTRRGASPALPSVRSMASKAIGVRLRPALKSARGDFRVAVALISALAVIVALIAVTIPDPLRRTDRD